MHQVNETTPAVCRDAPYSKQSLDTRENLLDLQAGDGEDGQQG